MPKFNNSVFKSIKIAIDKAILQSAKTLPNFRKEIQRIFHIANRRIQNIETKGYISPAFTALNLENNLKGKFSKFSMSGKDWNELKIEYAKAVEFLRKPTSTATGAKQYEKHLQKEFNLTNEQIKIVRNKLNNKHITEKENNFVENYLFKYKDFDVVFENAVNDISEQIETAAEKVENFSELEKTLNKDIVDNINNDILKNLHELGF